ncbi:tyrosine-type recombinase/integrase [Neobacillus vireti]|uniref:Integrase family protein n=1 Tax=Neobacillus vireti LMG 21834 TaxID=1131730 RepID=A0AB94IJN9_9BACI|nr:tyrosine-type recombinase/integrase [Neobacillus vireti]ETI67255.1 integrase family protein [Neobacillus vireti LMG 21834]KLT19650.1 integrase [Neobacillus vireti]
MQKTVRKYKRGESTGRNTKKILDALTLDEMFDKFMTFKKTEALAPRTIREYYIHFDYLKEFLGNDLTNEIVTLEDFRGYIGYMLHDKELSPMTVNIRIRTMRAFIRFCYTEGYIGTPIHENFKPVKAPEDTLESFTPMEIKKLLTVIDETMYTGFRDKVIVFVLLDTMVRISELVAMKRCNVDLKNGVIKLEAMGTKTRKAREVPISTKTSKLLKEYLQETEDFGDEHLFLTYDGHLMNHATVRINLRDYGRKAEINNKRVSPHTFRHTGALFYIMNGGDPFSLQKILGHSDMSMTRKYIQMTDTDVRRQHNSFSPINSIFGK